MTEEELNTQVMDALIELLKGMGSLGQQIGASHGLSGSDAMALHKFDEPISMKELSQRLGCDASFVTVIADSLERQGIAKREPSQRDRRVKNLVLTERGRAVRDEIIREVTARTPWSNALDISERECFLGLLNKMLGRVEGGAPVTTVTVPSS
ncbi:MAG TPA: MarR family transcriptional regulator [Streptosporangiaceae bacterium]